MKIIDKRWTILVCGLLMGLLVTLTAAAGEGDGDGSAFSSPVFLEYRAIEAIEGQSITIADTKYPLAVDLACYNDQGQAVDVAELALGTLVRFSLTAEGEVNAIWEKNMD